MSKISLASSVILLFTASMAAAANPVSIYGLPLGGTIMPKMKVCSDQQIGSPTALCWVGAPHQSADGGKYGSANIPDASLPKWAAYASHKLTTEKSGHITSISTDTDTPHKFDEIKASVSSRFGEPTSLRVRDTPIKTATWELDTVFIHMTQYGDKCCEISFRTPADIAEQRANLAEREKKEASRPLTP